MVSTQFVSWMEKFVEQHKELDRVLDIFYNEVGVDLINVVEKVGFESFAVNAMEIGLNDNEHWLTYFICDCNCNFDTFNNNVEIDGANVDVHSYEDLYFFIVGRS